MLTELVNVASQPAGDEELLRIKNMLKGSMLMNLESRSIMMEDVRLHKDPPLCVCVNSVSN